MTLRSAIVSIALVGAFIACGSAFASPPASDARAAPTDSVTPNDASGEGIACRTDADCPHLACGPCDAGRPITKAMANGPECAVNPCLDASSVCSAEQRCEIGPRTRKNPAVWKSPAR